LAQIALKNNLKMLSKRQVEIEVYKDDILKNSLLIDIYEKTLLICELDINEYSKGIKFAKKAIKNGVNGYYLIDYIKLIMSYP
jgi:hypothetical protein